MSLFKAVERALSAAVRAVQRCCQARDVRRDWVLLWVTQLKRVMSDTERQENPRCAAGALNRCVRPKKRQTEQLDCLSERWMFHEFKALGKLTLQPRGKHDYLERHSIIKANVGIGTKMSIQDLWTNTEQFITIWGKNMSLLSLLLFKTRIKV